MSSVMSEGNVNVKDKTYAKRIDHKRLAEMINFGTPESCPAMVTELFDDISFYEMDSFMQKLYIVMDVYVRISEFAAGLGIPCEKFIEKFGSIDEINRILLSPEHITDYFTKMTIFCVGSRLKFSKHEKNESFVRALEYIDEKYSQDNLSLKLVAEAMNYSSAYFSALFKKKMGVNFLEYLTALRINKAKLLLCSTSKTVSEISSEVGFKDYRYFSQVFKKHIGCTPSEYQAIRVSDLY